MFALSYTEAFYRLIEKTNRFLDAFFSSKERFSEYYLKLDGHYYCDKKNCMMAVIRVRNKRAIEKIPIQDIINDKNYLKELHPLDTCVLGILSNNERNGIVNEHTIGWRKMQRSKNCICPIKSDPILKISGKYINSRGIEITSLYSRTLNKEIDIPTADLAKNQALLYSLDSIEAITIGYNVSEEYLRKLQGVT